MLIIIYDNYCPKCTSFAKTVKKIDWLNLIIAKELRNEIDINSLRNLNKNLAEKQMASFNKKWHYGFNSLFEIFLRIPLFWLFLPLMYILKISKLGQFFYKELALKRKIIPLHCNSETCEI
jgi:predicted DCC family thiol-disulfide oxidoreductase YuxK